MTTNDLKQLLLNLIDQWQPLLQQTEEEHNAYEQGVRAGLAVAAEELRLLVQQAETSESALITDTSLVITPDAKTNEPAYDYFYVSFEQSGDGVWRVKQINGIWQPDWQSGLPFDEAVRRLSQQGWKLARFANGIHVFRREKIL